MSAAAAALRAARAYGGLARRMAATRLGSERPFKVTWMLTARCDCRCAGCFIWKAEKPREPTPEEIAAVLADAPSVRWVNLTGGEPFLRDDVPEIAAAILAARPELAVLDFPTTGQRTERILADVARIAALGIPRLYVTCSLEGPPALHDELRGRPGAFERMLATYRGLRTMPGVGVYLGMTLTDRNVDTVDETLAAVRAVVPEVTLRDVHFNVYVESPHYYANEGAAVGLPAQVGAAIAPALRARERSWHPTDAIEAAYLRNLPRYLETGRSPLPCQSLKANVFIDARGDVHPCTVYGRVLGNVWTRSLYDILDGAEAADARDVIARDACPGCWTPCEAHATIVARAPHSLLRQ